MDPRTKQILEEGGFSVDDLASEVPESLMVRLYGLFLADTSLEQCEQALADGDRERARRAMHTLKGSSGSIRAKALYALAAPASDAMRDALEAGVADITPANLAEIRKAYDAAKDAIRTAGIEPVHKK